MSSRQAGGMLGEAPLLPLPLPQALNEPLPMPAHIADFVSGMSDETQRCKCRNALLQMVGRLCRSLTLEQQCASDTVQQAYGTDKAARVNALPLQQKMQEYHELLSRAPHCVQIGFTVSRDSKVVCHNEAARDKTVLAVHSNFAPSLAREAFMQDIWQWSTEPKLPLATHSEQQILASREMYATLENSKMVREVYTTSCSSVWLLSNTAECMQKLLKDFYDCICRDDAQAPLMTQQRLELCIAFAVVMTALRTNAKRLKTLQSMPWSWKEEMARALAETSDTAAEHEQHCQMFRKCKLLLLCNCQTCKGFHSGDVFDMQQPATDDTKQMCSIAHFCTQYETFDRDAQQIFDQWYTLKSGVASYDNVMEHSNSCSCATCWALKNKDKFMGVLFHASMGIRGLPLSVPLSTQFHEELDRACSELNMKCGRCNTKSLYEFCQHVVNIMTEYESHNFSTSQAPQTAVHKNLREALCKTVLNSPALLNCVTKVIHYNAIRDDNVLLDIFNSQTALAQTTYSSGVVSTMPQMREILQPYQQHYKQIQTQMQAHHDDEKFTRATTICPAIIQCFHPEVLVMYALFFNKSIVVWDHFMSRMQNAITREADDYVPEVIDEENCMSEDQDALTQRLWSPSPVNSEDRNMLQIIDNERIDNSAMLFESLEIPDNNFNFDEVQLDAEAGSSMGSAAPASSARAGGAAQALETRQVVVHGGYAGALASGTNTTNTKPKRKKQAAKGSKGIGKK